MKSNYARKLNNSNILLGIHIAFKLVMILTLFVLLYSTIWVKEKYLTIIKSSAYIQIFILLNTSLIMLSINNPKTFDICIPFLNYFYLIISILQLGIIFCEIYFLIKNFKNFINIFHECPYYRTYEEIIEKDYKRTCLYYISDYNNELPYKYICYYNSENEYHNKFCDGFICRKNDNKNQINSYIKCYGNVDRNSIHFSGDNEFYLKEIELINRYKSTNLYACFRKEKIEKDENIFNQECPDSNPFNKMLIFIYCDIILHILADFLFIYEFFLIRKVKEIYSNLVLLQSRAPINYLDNEDELRNSNNSNTNKQTCNTDNRELLEYPQSLYTFNMQRENSQTIIIEPEFANNKIINIYQESEKGLKSQNQLSNFDNIEINNDNNEINNKSTIIQTSENNGVINPMAKIFNNKKRKDNKKNKININPKEYNISNNLNTKNRKQKMVIIDIKKDEEYGINQINFFIKKKAKKKRNKAKKEIDNEDIKDNNINSNTNSNEDICTIKTNININDNKDSIKITDDEEKKIQKFKINSKFNSKKNKNNSIENESLPDLEDDQKKKKSNSINNRKLKKNIFGTNKINTDIKNNSNIIFEKNNNCMLGFKKEFSENNLYANKTKKNNSGDKVIQNSLKKDILKNINIYRITNQQINEEKVKSKKNLINSSESGEIKENIKIKNKDNKKDRKDNTKIESSHKKFLNKIHINSEVFLNEEES